MGKRVFAGVSGFWNGWDALFLGGLPVLRVHADAEHVVEEVAPGGVLLFDEAELPGAAPFLDAAFAGEGVVAGGVGFGPDEPLAAVLLRVAVEGSVAVLEGADLEVVGVADVGRAVAAAGHDAGPEGQGRRPTIWAPACAGVSGGFEGRLSPSVKACFRCVARDRPAVGIPPSRPRRGPQYLDR